jgi:enamine deaminase RidA (YjgF/YER057c/UK114 family)
MGWHTSRPAQRDMDHLPPLHRPGCGSRTEDHPSALCWLRSQSAYRSLADCGVMAVHLVRSAQLFPGVPYAYAAKTDQADLIFTAGACPLDEQGQVVAPGHVKAQMRQALRNLEIALKESGATISGVLKTTVYVATDNRDDLIAAWNEVADFFGDHDVPSTLLGVAVLGYPGQLVEIEAVAVPSSR